MRTSQSLAFALVLSFGVVSGAVAAERAGATVAVNGAESTPAGGGTTAGVNANAPAPTGKMRGSKKRTTAGLSGSKTMKNPTSAPAGGGTMPGANAGAKASSAPAGGATDQVK